MRAAWQTIACLLLLASSTAFAEEEEEAVRVYRTVQQSVVSIHNIEGGGTGIILSSDGLILTNAHVLASPFPMTVDVDSGDGKPISFKKTRVAGFHPTLDLALLKVEVTKGSQLIPLQIAKKNPLPGQRVYAIGNPAAGKVVLSKTITSGMLSGVNREMEGALYHQFSAAINPGNSGGPLVDKAGQVLGLVTFKVSDVEGIGFAIPLTELNTSAFVPLQKRKPDPQKSLELIKRAEKYYALAEQRSARFGPKDELRQIYLILTAECDHEALTFDPSNPNIYYNLGMLLRSLDVDEIAVAYLMRAVQLKPWNSSDGREYLELGLALAKQKQDSFALAVWKEGSAKYPATGQIWANMAIYRIKHNSNADAAICAATALAARNPPLRRETMQKLLQEARAKLTPVERDIVSAQIQPTALTASFRKMELISRTAQSDGKPYITPGFERIVHELGSPEFEQNLPTSSTTRPATTRPSAG